MRSKKIRTRKRKKTTKVKRTKVKRTKVKRKSKRRRNRMKGGMRTSRGPPSSLKPNVPPGLSNSFSQSRGLEPSPLVGKLFKYKDKVLLKTPTEGWSEQEILEVDDSHGGDNTHYYISAPSESGGHYILSQKNYVNDNLGGYGVIKMQDLGGIVEGCLCPEKYPTCGKAKGGWVGGWCINSQGEGRKGGGCGQASGTGCKKNREEWLGNIDAYDD